MCQREVNRQFPFESTSNGYVCYAHQIYVQMLIMLQFLSKYTPKCIAEDCCAVRDVIVDNL